jgi:hypothetical protein
MHILAAACALAACCAAGAPVEWVFPRTGNCHEGIPFADGTTGVLAWGGGDTLNLTVGRADLWDRRGGYPWTDEQSYTNIVAAVRSGDAARLYGLFAKTVPPGEPRNPTLLPLGRVVVKIPGAELLRGELDPFTGMASIDFALGGATNRLEAAMCRWGGGLFAVRFPEGVDFRAEVVPSMESPEVRQALEPVGFGDAEKWRDGETGALGPGGESCGFAWRIPGDRPVSVRWWRNGREMLVRSERLFAKSPYLMWGGPPPTFEIVENESRAYWDAFWREGARVEVPDPVIQRIFDYGMYRFGAMTDPRGVPAGLQGPWLEDDKMIPWSGDYHFNINVQECYSPAYRGGHFAHLKPLFEMILSWRGALRENARRFAGIENGYVLPHSVDDRGTCIGGFWTGTIDHGSTAWVADMMWRYVEYSGDTAFLRDAAYDFMKGAMNVYIAMAEEYEGRLSIPLGPSPEWGADDVREAVGRDPSFQLALAHRLARDLLSAAALLGETPDPAWLDVERRLPPFARGDGGIMLFEGRPFAASHRHHSHLAGLYPFDTVDTVAEAAAVAAARERWIACGTSAWSGWCVPWASVLCTHFGDAARSARMLRDWDEYFCGDGRASHHDAIKPGFTQMTWRPWIMQMDGQCAAATAVMEMMVHEVDGRVEYFRGCPPEWKRVSFSNIALRGGRRVSGSRIDGKAETAVTE